MPAVTASAMSGSSRTLSRSCSVINDASSVTADFAPCPSATTLSVSRERSLRRAATCADRSSAAISALTRAAVDSAEAVFNSAMVCSCCMGCRFNEMAARKVPPQPIFCWPQGRHAATAARRSFSRDKLFISCRVCSKERRMSARARLNDTARFAFLCSIS